MEIFYTFKTASNNIPKQNELQMYTVYDYVKQTGTVRVSKPDKSGSY